MEWQDGRRDAVVFALEEESVSRHFSPRHLVRYCLDIADLYDTNRIVPVVVFLREAGRVESSFELGTERDSYLTFKYIARKLADEPVSRWWDSANVVARVNLPNMRVAEERRAAAYGQAVRGLLELETDTAKRDKYLEFIDIYSGLTDNQFERYREEHPEEGSTMAGVIERARNRGRNEGERFLLERQLRHRFGAVAPGVADRLGRASEDELAAWAVNVIDADTLDDVFDPMR